MGRWSPARASSDGEAFEDVHEERARSARRIEYAQGAKGRARARGEMDASGGGGEGVGRKAGERGVERVVDDGFHQGGRREVGARLMAFVGIHE